jgi:hypothetical protein
MKAQFFAMVLCAALAGGPCCAQTVVDQGPVRPGGVRVTTRAPEPGKWDVVTAANHSQRLFRCKPLACPDTETVLFKFSKSPALHPDPKALEKFATVEWPKRLRAVEAARSVLSERAEKLETLSSKTAVLKEYPSVVNESKLIGGRTAIYFDSVIIFAGPIMISIQSSSPNRELAHASLNQFLDVMKIVSGPPAAGVAPQHAPGRLQPGTEHI